MKKIDLAAAPVKRGTGYPEPHDGPCKERTAYQLGNAAGLTQFGVVMLSVPPGQWSSQRHWHEKEDEFVYVLEGELVLVTDSGEEIVRAGECVGFPCGTRDGHHFQNRSGADAKLLIVGTRDDSDWGEYSDIDMKFHPGRYSGKSGYTRKNGEKL